MNLMADLVRKIKQKKELSGVDNSVIEKYVAGYLEKNKIAFEGLSSSQLKIVVKDVRSALRESVGRFQASTKDRYKLLDRKDVLALLKTHSSTKERFDFYPQFKEIIRKLNADSILDLGCGINPLALAEPGIKYYASDININDLNLVKAFFKKYDIEGEVFICDLTRIEKCSLPKTSLSLILKVFDILGKNDYEIARKVLENVKSEHIIVSFSTRTLSGKPMNSPRRAWFERLLGSLFYKFEIVKSSNEIFYII